MRSNEAFLKALLPLVAQNAKTLKEAREKARLDARRAAPGSPFVLAAETDTARGETIEFAAFAWTTEISPVSGKPVLRFDPKKPIAVKLPLFAHAKATVTAPRPAAYLVPAGWPEVEKRLEIHGIRYTKLDSARTLEVGTYRLDAPVFAPAPYQGLTSVTGKVTRGKERREIPAGSLYVPLDTELAPLVMHLLEPESPDSLFAWGKLSAALEMKEYVDLRVLDPLAEEMLAKDPALKTEWERRLKDPAFAADTRARYAFFYSRTPYWDDAFRLVPVYRLDAPLDVKEPAGAAAAGGGPG